MNRNNILLIFLFLFTQISFGQTGSEKLIHWKIFADSSAVERIDVVNLVNEKGTLTNAKGVFFILAKAGDVLVFSSVNLEFKRILITEGDLKLDILTVNMIPKITELNEVVVNEHP